MAIVVIEGGHPNGMDLVSSVVRKRKLSRFVDDEEFRGTTTGLPGLRTRASSAGVLIREMPARMLGVHQARMMADAILRAAAHAEERGAPEHILGG